ncbi:MAG: DUF3108 domain-containing protein [Nitrospirae bacterium]|nr:DUF3108 domain-containing protein [Nitrospirota bacterium]
MTKQRRQKSEVRSQKKIIMVLILCSVLCLLSSVFCLSIDAGQPVNNKFVYYIYWSGIKAGTAEFTFENSPEGLTLTTYATSAPVISIFYKVEDFAQSTLDPDGYPKSFILKASEGRHKRDKETYFESMPDGKHKVNYYDKIKDKRAEFFFDQPAYDPLSAFFAMTKMSLEEGQSKFIDIFDSKKLYHTEIQVLKKEKVRVPAGEFNTILVKPLLKSEGLFRKTGDIFIWATDDDRKLPVLLKSKAVIGSFTVELAEGDY